MIAKQGNEGWPGITSKAVGKKATSPLPTTLLNCITDFLIVYVCMCMYVCTYHWAPGRVAFRLKVAPVKIRIFILLSFIKTPVCHITVVGDVDSSQPAFSVCNLLCIGMLCKAV